MSKGAQIAVGASLVVALLGWFAVTNVGTFRYYETLDEFQLSGSLNQPSRVHGYVVEGSIDRDLAAREVRFAVQNAPPHGQQTQPQAATADTLPVVFAGLETPDLFRGGAEVVVEGQLQLSGSDRVFAATNVLAKCPSKFEAKAAEQASAPAPY